MDKSREGDRSWRASDDNEIGVVCYRLCRDRHSCRSRPVNFNTANLVLPACGVHQQRVARHALPECQWSSPTENRGVGHWNEHQWIDNRFSDRIVIGLDAEWIVEFDAEWIVEFDLQWNFADEPELQHQLVGRCHAAPVLTGVA